MDSWGESGRDIWAPTAGERSDQNTGDSILGGRRGEEYVERLSKRSEYGEAILWIGECMVGGIDVSETS